MLRRVKLGRCLDTVPERLALARAQSLPHADLLSLLLADEVERRDRSSAQLPARTAKLDPAVLFARADQLFRHLKAARLDNSIAAEMRRLARVGLLILDDFALQSMDQTETADFYGLTVERHHKTATILTSTRDPSEWIGQMSEPPARSIAVDRLVATSYELVIEGESYRRRQRPHHATGSDND